MRLFIFTLLLRLLPRRYRVYANMAIALAPLMSEEVAEELTEVAKDGVLTWGGWLRVGRRAGLQSRSKTYGPQI